MDSYSRDAAGPSPPLDLSHHYSRASIRRKDSEIKAIYKYFMIPGIGNLAGGLPNDKLFPFDTLEAQIATPERWEPTPNYGNTEQATKARAVVPRSLVASSHITVPKAVAEPNPDKKIDLATALQYGTAEGYPALRSFIRQFTKEVLHPVIPYAGGPEVLLTCGSTDGFSKTAELLVNPWFDDKDAIKDRPGMLCEAFIYMGPMSSIKPKGVQVVPVEYDSEGMMAEGPGGLADVLENWDFSRGRRPHFLYTVTMGHNPTGGVVSVPRRRQIYALCSKYDVIIVEDDPYWYLQYPSAIRKQAEARGASQPCSQEPPKPVKSSGYEFIDSLVPSYLSIDTDGRVIRLDTFSKTIAPGCRLGWITAQPAIITQLRRITEATTQQPSGFVQAMVAETLMGPQPEATATFRGLSLRDKHTFNGWNTDGWVRWVAGLRGVYERRMNTMCSILEEHSTLVKQGRFTDEADADWGVVTKTRIMSFDWPRGGMFIWVRLMFETHPLWGAKGDAIPVIDGEALSTGLFGFLSQKPHLVLPAPGSLFAPTPEVVRDRSWAYVRVCFAAVDEDDVTACSQRLGNGVQKFWQVTSVKQMEKYIAGPPSELDEAGMPDQIGFPIGC